MSTPDPQAAASAGLAVPSVPLDQWVRLGVDGDVLAIGTSPSYSADGTVLAATGAGVWRSADGGQTWQPTAGVTPGDRGLAIAFSPVFATDRTVFLGAAQTIYRSTDGGASWQSVGHGRFPVCPTCPNVTGVAVSPAFATDRTVFVATAYGPHRSVDGGASWAPVGGIDPFGVIGGAPYSIVVSPGYADDRTLLIAPGGRVLRSTNGGETWADVFVVDTERSGNPSYLALSPSFPADGHVFFGVTSGTYHSRDGGATWVRSNAGRDLTNAGPMVAPPSYPADGRVYLAVAYAGRSVWRSLDGGELGAARPRPRRPAGGRRRHRPGRRADRAADRLRRRAGRALPLHRQRERDRRAPAAPPVGVTSCAPGGAPVADAPGAFLYDPAVTDARMVAPGTATVPAPPPAASEFRAGDGIRFSWTFVPRVLGEDYFARVIAPDGTVYEWARQAVSPRQLQPPRSETWTYPMRLDILGWESLAAGRYRHEVVVGDRLAVRRLGGAMIRTPGGRATGRSEGRRRPRRHEAACKAPTRARATTSLCRRLASMIHRRLPALWALAAAVTLAALLPAVYAPSAASAMPAAVPADLPPSGPRPANSMGCADPAADPPRGRPASQGRPLVFDDFIAPLVDDARARRARLAADDPRYRIRVDEVLNARRLNVALLGYAEEHGQSYEGAGITVSVLSLDIDTWDMATISLSRDTRVPSSRIPWRPSHGARCCCATPTLSGASTASGRCSRTRPDWPSTSRS